MESAARPVFHGSAGKGPRASSPADIVSNQLEAEGLRRAGVRVLLASVWPPPATSPERDALGEAVHQLNVLKRWARARAKDFAIASDASEARGIVLSGRIALIPAVEGGEGIGRPEDVDLLFAAGAREMQPVHFVDDELAGAAAGQVGRFLGGVKPGTRSPKGLTPLGKATVERMVKLGMLVDLAHMSDRGAQDVLAATAAAKAPLIFSHGGARALSEMERNVSDELAREVAARGGLVGVTLYREFVGGVPAAERFPGFVPDTCDEVVAHWLHLARIVGPEALSLGSDLNGFIARPGPGGRCPAGIRGSWDLPELFAALVEQGVAREALDASGERLLAAWATAERGADADLRHAALQARPAPRGETNLP